MSKEICFGCNSEIETEALNTNWVLDGEQQMQPIHPTCFDEYEISRTLGLFDDDEEDDLQVLDESSAEDDEDSDSDDL